jgi:hypothetical protein
VLIKLFNALGGKLLSVVKSAPGTRLGRRDNRNVHTTTYVRIAEEGVRSRWRAIGGRSPPLNLLFYL